MDIWSRMTDAPLSFSGLGDFATISELSVTACELSDGVWVCQTTNSEDPSVVEITEEDDGLDPTDMLSLDERQFLSEFFLPIADALSDVVSEAMVVPSQYEPIQVYALIEITGDDEVTNADNLNPTNINESFGTISFNDAGIAYFDEGDTGYLDDADLEFYNDVDFGYHNDLFIRDYNNADISNTFELLEEPYLADYGFAEYDPYDPIVMRLKPKLVKKWRQVPCHRHYQPSNTEFLFINSDNLGTLDEAKVCGMLTGIVILTMMLLICCITQKMRLNRRRAREKNQFQADLGDAGDVGNYKPPSFTMAVKRKPEKSEGEPHIIFI